MHKILNRQVCGVIKFNKTISLLLAKVLADKCLHGKALWQVELTNDDDC